MLVVLMVLVVLVVLLVLVVLVVLVALVVLVVLNLESVCGDCHGFPFSFFSLSISQSQIFKTYSLTPCPTLSTPHQPNTQQQNRTKKHRTKQLVPSNSRVSKHV